MLHFQTFVNARQHLPKEPLEVYAAEITRLGIEAFPEYGKPAIAMERFRRFAAGLDPILQAKCHEHGAATLEDALAVAVNGSVQEALKLLSPPVIAPALTSSATPAPQEELFGAIMSTRQKKSQSDPSAGLFEAVKQLSNDLHALRLEVSQLGCNPDLAVQHYIPHVAASTQKYDQQDEQRYQRGRERYHRPPSVSPDRGGHSPARCYRRSSCSHSDHDHHRLSCPAAIIALDIPLLTIKDDTSLLLHLLHLTIIILLTSRIASGGAAQTGATPIIVQVNKTHIMVTLTDTPPITQTDPGMIRSLPSLPGRDTNSVGKGTAMPL